MNATLFSSLSNYSSAGYECHTVLPPSFRTSHLTVRKIAFCLRFSVCFSYAFSTSFPSATQKAATCQSCYACNMTWRSIKYKPFQTHLTHLLLPVHKEHLSGNQSIHAGYYYSWGLQWEGHHLHACYHAHAPSRSIYSAGCSCVSPAGRWGFQLWWFQRGSPECRPCAVFMRRAHV